MPPSTRRRGQESGVSTAKILRARVPVEVAETVGDVIRDLASPIRRTDHMDSEQRLTASDLSLLSGSLGTLRDERQKFRNAPGA